MLGITIWRLVDLRMAARGSRWEIDRNKLKVGGIQGEKLERQLRSQDNNNGNRKVDESVAIQRLPRRKNCYNILQIPGQVLFGFTTKGSREWHGTYSQSRPSDEEKYYVKVKQWTWEGRHHVKIRFRKTLLTELLLAQDFSLDFFLRRSSHGSRVHYFHHIDWGKSYSKL